MLDLDAVMVAEREMAKKPEKQEPKTLFAVKGFPEWFEWLQRYADHVGLPMMSVIDTALRNQAKRDEFPEPMPRRIGRSAK